MSEQRVCALLLAGGAGWEAGVLQALGEAGIVVTKRCVDVPDLMVAASSGGAAVAVVAAEVPQLDAEAVMHLLRYDVRTLGVTTEPALAGRLARLGVVETCRPDAPQVVEAVRRVSVREVVADPETAELAPSGETAAGRGRVLAVWGPAGAPGRTTVAVGLADGLASAGHRIVLVDADPYGGTVAQHLGVLDEMSGLLAVARMANLGTLDRAALVRCCRGVGARLDVLTGLPRADRRVEVRPGVLGTVLDVAAGLGDVVVDCGFCLEDAEVPLSRDRMTIEVLETADEVVVVGSAEPSGLARLARGLVELRDVAGGTPVRVVVNRMRPTLGWSERDIVGMVEGYVRPVGMHFLPEDRVTADRALVAGRALGEVGESRLRTALSEVVAALGGSAATAHAHVRAGSRRRRGGRARTP
ncbi:MinD-like ATPase involved in chromosome partitioning or flagellar assembly [Marmoricola sp. URHA0025 HA25]